MARTTDRGYGTAHQRLRAELAPAVERGEYLCAWCRKPILPGSLWDLGHVDGSNKTLYSGPEHRRCNRATSTRKKQRRSWLREW